VDAIVDDSGTAGPDIFFGCPAYADLVALLTAKEAADKAWVEE